MKRKLIKYTKFVVSVALILSLVAPSYAALSASDGSAFVTKAEFDSALADFNARLTTFEAGINSKIDSQVTSYLDRNGIWSGKDQELAIPSKQIYLNDDLGSGGSTKNFFHLFYTSDVIIKIEGNTYQFCGLDVTKPFSKSGLLAVDTELMYVGTTFNYTKHDLWYDKFVSPCYEWVLDCGVEVQIAAVGSPMVYGDGAILHNSLYTLDGITDKLGGTDDRGTGATSTAKSGFRWAPKSFRSMVFGFCNKDTDVLRIGSYANMVNSNKPWSINQKQDVTKYGWKYYLVLHSIKIY